MSADVGLNFWLTQWNWQPSIIFGTIAAIYLYLYAIGPLRVKYRLGPPVQTGKAVAYVLGVNLIFLSLFSPLDKLGDTYLFSAHMVQHLVLTMVGPPLMIIGLPDWLVQPLLRKRVILRVGRLLTYPGVAFILYNVNFWLWHAPSLYNAALYNETLHIFEHVTFIGMGFLYWWPVFSPLREGWPRLSMTGQLLYLFLGGMPTVLLGAGLTFTSPLYTPYLYAPRVWGLSAVTDQQLGGLVMWIPVNIATIVVAAALFIRWMQEQEARQRVADAELYAENDADGTSSNVGRDDDGGNVLVEEVKQSGVERGLASVRNDTADAGGL